MFELFKQETHNVLQYTNELLDQISLVKQQINNIRSFINVLLHNARGIEEKRSIEPITEKLNQLSYLVKSFESEIRSIRRWSGDINLVKFRDKIRAYTVFVCMLLTTITMVYLLNYLKFEILLYGAILVIF